MALKDAHGGAGWTQWDAAIARRKPEAMQAWREKLSSDIFSTQIPSV